MEFPQGFSAHTGNIGIKDDKPDVLIIATDRPVPTSGLYTRSLFAGPSIVVSREHGADGTAQAMVIVARNANVATGPEGLANAREMAGLTSSLVGCDDRDILVAATGVIGRLLPMDRVRTWFATQSWTDANAEVADAAAAIMTTDTHPKTASASAGPASVVGIAKGVGMIEPDMATMITVVATDAEIASSDLDPMWRRVVDKTFNAVSVDTDTSTSDTAVVMASGAAGPVDSALLEQALGIVALDLTRQIAADGEGAETLIVVKVDGARDNAQAKRVGKAIVNSPLVKTAVHGADPNWGRVAMAIGKCSDETDIEQDNVVIRFGTEEVYPRLPGDLELAALSEYLAGPEVLIHVSLGVAGGEFTVFGCDLTDGYIRINADYTT
ncbi:MAG: bifunctional glutamate N-acetyltransferase/amino-acid acetyltransferase ArgJ [Actinomycetia bacterium]|nr:bifunctional glutamate N-acetyltransferase/amino-acid acetyltransferase ArgJ [Actinomycetes bacterium]MCP4963183.1 bifunctional glutamate N-acetyltransferase/amino-acid acetyltransferase ArgJ [Actinomycetes bacterium]